MITSSKLYVFKVRQNQISNKAKKTVLTWDDSLNIKRRGSGLIPTTFFFTFLDKL